MSTLASRIVERSHLTGAFRLRSGATSTEYFDKYRFEADPALLREVAGALVPLVPDGTEALAGLELGGVPIATVLSQLTRLPTLFVRKHVHPWLIGDLELADGSLVAFSATDYVRHRKQTKRNPRGKIKTKVKAVVKTDLRVSVRLKTAVYAVEATAAPGVRIKPGENRTALRVRRERKLPSRVIGWGSAVMPGEGLAAADVVDALADAYRRAARP